MQKEVKYSKKQTSDIPRNTSGNWTLVIDNLLALVETIKLAHKDDNVQLIHSIEFHIDGCLIEWDMTGWGYKDEIRSV